MQGPDAADVHAGLQELSPDLATYILEAGFADVYGRPGLDLQQRQLLNVAALTTLGGCEPQRVANEVFDRQGVARPHADRVESLHPHS